MNILIIYCHPSKKSYTYSILVQLQTLLAQKNWDVEVSDLYALNFQKKRIVCIILHKQLF